MFDNSDPSNPLITLGVALAALGSGATSVRNVRIVPAVLLIGAIQICHYGLKSRISESKE